MEPVESGSLAAYVYPTPARRAGFAEVHSGLDGVERSEERRVGKGCRSRLSVGQAEDGIRDWSVTGVQTCALPISLPRPLDQDIQTTRMTIRAIRATGKHSLHGTG